MEDTVLVVVNQTESTTTTETETPNLTPGDPLAPFVSNTAPVEKLAYNTHEVAAMIGVKSVETIRRLAKRGKLKRVGGIRHLLFSRKEIERFLAR